MSKKIFNYVYSKRKITMTKEQVKQKITDWVIENFEEVEGYWFIKTNIFGKVKRVELISYKPGILIGKGGETINKLQNELKGVKVKIIDGFGQRLLGRKYYDNLIKSKEGLF